MPTIRPVSRITLRSASPDASFTRTISSYTFAYRPDRNAPRSITMSTSCAPISTTSRTSASFTSSGACPDGKAVATEATFTPLPRSRSTATGTRFGYTHTAATDGIDGSTGSGRTAFEQSATTFPGVSAPSSVVRSIVRIARSSAQSFASRLIDRFPSVAARSSTATWSTEPMRGSRGSSGSSKPRGRTGACAIPTSLGGARPLAFAPVKAAALQLLRRLGLLRPAYRAYEALGALRATGRRAPAAEDGLPVPPPRLIVRVAGTADVSWFLESGRLAAESLQDVLARHGRTVEEL